MLINRNSKINKNASKFLVVLYKMHQMAGSTVQSRSIEDTLRWDYRTSELCASYWKDVGALDRFSKRGGTAEYRLTPLGIKLAVKLKKERFAANVIMWISILVLLISVTFFAYYMGWFSSLLNSNN